MRNGIAAENRKNSATDAYFFSGALEKPIIGPDSAESKDAEKTISRERKNEKRDPLKIDRIVVAPSGDMGYAYGTGHMSFDEVSTGKHVDFTAAFLTVWRVVDGSCKETATMFQPEGER